MLQFVHSIKAHLPQFHFAGVRVSTIFGLRPDLCGMVRAKSCQTIQQNLAGHHFNIGTCVLWDVINQAYCLGLESFPLVGTPFHCHCARRFLVQIGGGGNIEPPSKILGEGCGVRGFAETGELGELRGKVLGGTSS